MNIVLREKADIKATNFKLIFLLPFVKFNLVRCYLNLKSELFTLEK